MLGNIALFDINGKEIWEQHVKSAVTQVSAAAAKLARESAFVSTHLC